VSGATPLLFSKRAFKLLGGTLDTKNDTCKLTRIDDRVLELDLSQTGLLNGLELYVYRHPERCGRCGLCGRAAGGAALTLVGAAAAVPMAGRAAGSWGEAAVG